METLKIEDIAVYTPIDGTYGKLLVNKKSNVMSQNVSIRFKTYKISDLYTKVAVEALDKDFNWKEIVAQTYVTTDYKTNHESVKTVLIKKAAHLLH